MLLIYVFKITKTRTKIEVFVKILEKFYLNESKFKYDNL